MFHNTAKELRITKSKQYLMTEVNNYDENYAEQGFSDDF